MDRQKYNLTWDDRRSARCRLKAMADKPSKLKIADREFTSRLLVGTGKFASNELMRDALEASGTELVTVAPEMTTPGETAELCASPNWPAAPWTSLAGASGP